MTDAEKLSQLKALLQITDTTQDAILTVYLTLAANKGQRRKIHDDMLDAHTARGWVLVTPLTPEAPAKVEAHKGSKKQSPKKPKTWGVMMCS